MVACLYGFCSLQSPCKIMLHSWFSCLLFTVQFNLKWVSDNFWSLWCIMKLNLLFYPAMVIFTLWHHMSFRLIASFSYSFWRCLVLMLILYLLVNLVFDLLFCLLFFSCWSFPAAFVCLFFRLADRTIIFVEWAACSVNKRSRGSIHKQFTLLGSLTAYLVNVLSIDVTFWIFKALRSCPLTFGI